MDLGDLLIPSTRDEPTLQRWGWGTVTQVNPPRIRMDGDTLALSATPTLLTGPVQLGQRVWVQLYGHRLLVTGVANGNFWRPYDRYTAVSGQSRASGSNSGFTWQLDFSHFGGLPMAGVSYIRTIPVSGEWRIAYRLTWAGNGTGTRSCDIRKNPTGTDMSTGTTLDRDQQAGSAASLTSLHLQWTGELLAGDNIAASCVQTSGVTLDIIAQPYQTWWELEYMRAPE